MNKATLILSAVLLGAVAFAGPAKHEAFEPDGKPHQAANAAIAAWTGLRGGDWYGQYDRDVMTDPAGLTEKVTIQGWRGERVHAQLVLSSADGFKEVTLLRPKYGTLQLLRYTAGDGVLYADIVEPNPPAKFKGITRPLLYTYDIPANAAAGKITDTLQVMLNGKCLSLPVEITVQEKVLPPVSDWRVHLDIWQHPDAIARWHDVPAYGPEHLALAKPYLQILAQMGQKVITTTLVDEAWNEQTYDKFRSMIGYTKRADGTWSYDYSRFDDWVQVALDAGINQQISCYTLVTWSLVFPYWDEATQTTKRPKLQPGSAEYEAFWGPFLQDFVKHLRTKGWLKITKLAMDERPDHLLKPALAVAKKYAPELGYVAACDRPSKMNDAIDDVSYAYAHSEQLVPLAASRRAAGKSTTFYVCLNPKRPNTFMWSTPAEAEWLMAYAAHCGLDGFLRWAYSSWVENPLKTNDYTAFPTGDTSLVYPGPRLSMRLVHMRDGVERFEKLATLETKPAALGAFTTARGKETGIHAADLRALDQSL